MRLLNASLRQTASNAPAPLTMPALTAPVPDITSLPLTTRSCAASSASLPPRHETRRPDGTRPGGHPATFAPAAGGTADRPA